VPLADAAHAWARQCAGGSTALDHALGDGEDFELILAVPAAAARDMIARQPLTCGLTQIGQFVAEPGLWQQDALGNRRPLAPRGYEHE
jgi:thiamine-monophosphate kinase